MGTLKEQKIIFELSNLRFQNKHRKTAQTQTAAADTLVLDWGHSIYIHYKQIMCDTHTHTHAHTHTNTHAHAHAHTHTHTHTHMHMHAHTHTRTHKDPKLTSPHVDPSHYRNYCLEQ